MRELPSANTFDNSKWHWPARIGSRVNIIEVEELLTAIVRSGGHANLGNNIDQGTTVRKLF